MKIWYFFVGFYRLEHYNYSWMLLNGALRSMLSAIRRSFFFGGKVGGGRGGKKGGAADFRPLALSRSEKKDRMIAGLSNYSKHLRTTYDIFGMHRVLFGFGSVASYICKSWQKNSHAYNSEKYWQVYTRAKWTNRLK